jgi:hypothetical protein
MFDKDLAIDTDLVDMDLVEEFSDADPSSREYRRMMKKIGIGGRNFKNSPRRWRDEYDD